MKTRRWTFFQWNCGRRHLKNNYIMNQWIAAYIEYRIIWRQPLIGWLIALITIVIIQKYISTRHTAFKVISRFIFSCDEQLYKSCFPSVCLCVCLCVTFFCGTFFQKVSFTSEILENIFCGTFFQKVSFTLENIFVGHFFRK